MLGPNVIPSIHHREIMFMELFQDLQTTFKRVFDVSDDYIVLPITGSGTLALEILINSLDLKFKHLYTDEEFGSRFQKINHNEQATDDDDADGYAYCNYETSISKFNHLTNYNKVETTIIDAVSSFPYYNIPKGTGAWVTVNSKQLGCNPGLSFIVIHERLLKYVKDEEFSVLSLKRYLNYNEKHQTPNTPAISLLQETLESLQNFSVHKLKKKIISRSEMLSQYFPDSVGSGPVFTINSSKKNDKFKKEFNLYGKTNIQLFLWSGSDHEYIEIEKYLKENYDSFITN